LLSTFAAFAPHRVSAFCSNVGHREEDIIFHSPEGPWAAKSAPLRILSFDIEEMVAPNAGFPRYDHEPIIQIGNMLAIKGEPRLSLRLSL
jgi:hypothetical protein